MGIYTKGIRDHLKDMLEMLFATKKELEVDRESDIFIVLVNMPGVKFIFQEFQSFH